MGTVTLPSDIYMIQFSGLFYSFGQRSLVQNIQYLGHGQRQLTKTIKRQFNITVCVTTSLLGLMCLFYQSAQL